MSKKEKSDDLEDVSKNGRDGNVTARKNLNGKSTDCSASSSISRSSNKSSTTSLSRTSIKEANNHLQEMHARLELLKEELGEQRKMAKSRERIIEKELMQKNSELDELSKANRKLVVERDNLQILVSNLDQKLDKANKLNEINDLKLKKIELSFKEIFAAIDDESPTTNNHISH